MKPRSIALLSILTFLRLLIMSGTLAYYWSSLNYFRGSYSTFFTATWRIEIFPSRDLMELFLVFFSSVNTGVAERSVLGPILFTIYCSDMPQPGSFSVSRDEQRKHSVKMLLCMYADDTAILLSHYSQKSAHEALQRYLRFFSDWALKLGLIFYA